MANNVLLLGAGFTCNWGGLSARQMRSAIAQRLVGDVYLERLFHQAESFETALASVQGAYKANPSGDEAVRLRRLQQAVTEAFGDMNKDLSRSPFEFCNDREFSVGHYLTQFDAIFTLNQDLFLERHYLHPHQGIVARSQNRLNGAVLAGVDMVPDNQYHGDDQPLHTFYRPSAKPSALQARIQPIYKLHGSVNGDVPRDVETFLAALPPLSR